MSDDTDPVPSSPKSDAILKSRLTDRSTMSTIGCLELE
jgi:hypothetical protein